MLEVSIAVGVLYVSLPAARYREKLFDAIVAGFRAENTIVSRRTKAALDRLRSTESPISNDFFVLAMWCGELPPGRRNDVKGTAADFFADVTDPSRPPWSYLWFRANLDKTFSALFAVAVPIAMRWLSSWYPEIVPQDCYNNALVFGQAFVGVQVLLGTWMVQQQSRIFTKKLRKMVAHVQGTIPSLPPIQPPPPPRPSVQRPPAPRPPTQRPR